jgi:hypothetical protein
MRQRRIALVLGWLIAVAVPVGARAETATEARLRKLEAALKDAQDEIDFLRQEMRRQKAATETTKTQLEETKKVQQEVAKKPEAKPGQFPIKGSYKLGKGLTFETEDKKFQVSIYNRIQGRYTYFDTEEPGEDDTSSFRVRRFKTVFEGHAYSPTLLYKLQVNWPGTPELEDGFLHWKPRPYFGAQGGQYKVPFNRQQLTSSGAQQFVDRAVTDDYFTFARDQGVTVTGSWFGEKHDLLEWNAGVFNGNGINRSSNENSDHLGVARVMAMPLGKFDYYVESDVEDTPSPRFGLGLAGAFNSQADSTASSTARIFSGGRLGTFFGDDAAGRFDVTQATVDAHFKWRGASLLGDFYWAQADPNLGTVMTANGYNLQAGYFILPKRLEAAFRWAHIDRVEGESRDLREVGGALGYFFYGHNLKIQADVRNLLSEVPGGPDIDDMEYRAQVQAIF